MTSILPMPSITNANASRGSAVKAWLSTSGLQGSSTVETSRGAYEVVAMNPAVKQALALAPVGSSVVSIHGSVLKRPGQMDAYRVTSLDVVAGNVEQIDGTQVTKQGDKFFANGHQLQAMTDQVKLELPFVSGKHAFAEGMLNSATNKLEIWAVQIPLFTRSV